MQGIGLICRGQDFKKYTVPTNLWEQRCSHKHYGNSCSHKFVGIEYLMFQLKINALREEVYYMVV